MVLASLGLVILFASSTLTAGEVDVLAISSDFLSLPRTVISVVEVPQPPNQGGKLEIAPTLGRIMTDELVGALQREIPAGKIKAIDPKSVQPEGLVVESHFSKLVPGSRAKRFWVGFGAGKAVLEVSGEVRDAESGRTVARFTHARLSWCCGFGSNATEIRDNLIRAAEDIAAVIAGHFSSAQKYEQLPEEGPAKAVQAAPPSGTSTIAIKSSAEHAEVEVDGKFLGTTPLEISLSAGGHKLLVRKVGFRPWSRDVELLAGSRQEVWADLQADR